MPDVFLSYSREDQATARRFAEALPREGFSVWWDQALSPGEAFDRVTENALAEARAVVVLWSNHSVESRWVRAEATQADRNGTLVPAIIGPCKLPIMFELTQAADLSHWSGNEDDPAWQMLVSALRRLVNNDGKVPVSQPAVLTTRRVRGGSRGRWVAVVGLALLAIGGGVLWKLGRGSGKPAAALAAQSEVVTLAVLPFVDLSQARDQEYFSDGLTEEILNQLAQVKALRVTGRTSSFSFKGKNEDLRVIGEQLGVAHLLEGSIRKEDNRLRITAQLIDTKDGAHRWSRAYDRELAGVFAVQEEIAKDVAQALRVSLDVGETSRALGGTTNVEAYEKYLQARQLVSREGRADSRQATLLLREAVDLDPQFAQAWALLTISLDRMQERDPDEDPAALRQEQERARVRVQALAPDSDVARENRILDAIRDHRWADAEAEYRRSNQILPAVPMILGRISEALPLMEHRARQDPLSVAESTNLQVLLDQGRGPAAAQAEYERSKSLSGDHGRADHFALVRLIRTDAGVEKIRAQFRVFLDSAPLPMTLDRELFQAIGNPVAARAAIRRALDDPANQHPTRQLIIGLYADAWDDRETALVATRRAVVGPFYNLAPAMIWSPFRTGLRADPAFKDILRDMGLAEHFRASGNWGDFCKPVGDDDFECR